MTTDTATATYTVRVIRTTTESPISTSHNIQSIPDRDAAIQVMGYYRDDTDAISFEVTRGGVYAGSGVAGHGRFLYDVR